MPGTCGEQLSAAVNGEGSTTVLKTPKQLEKEAKKQAKLDKLKNKLEKQQAAPVKKEEKKDKKRDTKEEAVYTLPTPDGDKKDVSCPMPDAYSPKYVEAAWYPWWEKKGFFKPQYGEYELDNPGFKEKFIIVIPPPNVTGSLHLGHALTNAIQDTLVRWHRMMGHITLWNPGCDHAGIATQVVVEKKIWREEHVTRHDLGREAFIQRVWQWKQEKGDRIYHQLRKLGSSFDWDRAKFTMDASMCRAVTEAFVRLHENGTIYRSKRLVNWSCTLKSAISDIEVDKVQLNGRTMLTVPGYTNKIPFGELTHFAYEAEDGSDRIVVATTRIETMLGDTAIAVHPDDERYKSWHGKNVRHPFANRLLPIVLDEFVDRDFGTGAVKITPAHDANDYEVGERHKLPFITIFDDEGCICGDYGTFTGMKRFDARYAITEELKARNLYVDSKDNPMVVPICSRSKDIIEPMLKPQWYVRCDVMAKKAVDAVKNGELRIVPSMYASTWNYWLTNIRDWCISRQLWWGHRIPAYKVTLVDEELPTVSSMDEEVWVSARSKSEAMQKASERFKCSVDKIRLTQDEDVLDTWFSSGLFPFSIFGWPDNTKDLRIFYPTSLLETGHDILFFWVARMVFLGQELLGQLPFKQIYLHPIVRDAHGRKMSKSLGNVVDPMDVIQGISLERLHEQLLDGNLDAKEMEKAKAGQKQDYPDGIPECGTDALRFALCAMCGDRDINLDILRVQGYRFFCNKIWNATKFALNYIRDIDMDALTVNATSLMGNEHPMDLWMLSRLTGAVWECNDALHKFEFPRATTAVYNVWWYELCDVYLEHLKSIFTQSDEKTKQTARVTLCRTLDVALRLLSPFMPFITEELYQRLPKSKLTCQSICIATYPEANVYAQWKHDAVEEEVDLIQRIAKGIRSARSDYTVPNKVKTEVFLQNYDDETLSIVKKYEQVLETLSFCSRIVVGETAPNGCAIITVSDRCEVHLVLRGLIDPTKEIVKLEKRMEMLTATRDKLQQAIGAPSYKEKVPQQVQQDNTDKLEQSLAEIQRIEAAIGVLKLV